MALEKKITKSSVSRGLGLVVLTMALVLNGCASKDFVREETAKVSAQAAAQLAALAAEVKGQQAQNDAKWQAQEHTLRTEQTRTNGRIDDLAKDVTGTVHQLIQTRVALDKTEARVDALTTTAQDALRRATAAGKLAEGKLLYAATLTQAVAGFALNKAELGAEAKAVLKGFADTLKAANKNIYIEIQGHTDTSGNAAVNQRLSEARALAVRDFLYREGGIPLHRMDVFAYGPAQPLVDNKTRAGRQQNRRVVLMVLQ